jgi:hypothetical protein
MMTLQEYLTPDPNIRGPRLCPDFTPDPPVGLATREMSLHSAISTHGFTFIDGRKVWYESILERCCALLARLRPDVTEIAEQPQAVTYVDDEGHIRTHTFDFRFTTSALGRVLMAVKPSALVAKTGIKRTVDLIREQIPPSVADFVGLFTEKKLSTVDLFNADAINLAGRDPWPEDDAGLDKIVRKLTGKITIGELVEKSKLGGCGFDAVVRAIDARKLRLVEYTMLDFDAVVARPVKKD